ncbi:hypothetical protein CRG98_015154 [Punica granatum]|uniref:Uncharacterized protein n=1 Tax=Punica granatum TaxID=22663 RepID=A0A2I0K799_PUNGR|nr:hypothetical protein CRG98_015154 [Punica granatum]
MRSNPVSRGSQFEMNMENMLLLMLAVYSHIANSSSAPEEEGDEEAPPPALDPVEAAPPPPLAQHMGPRLDSPFASTSGTSSYTAPSGASARLSRDVDVELALGAAHRSLLGSPRPECPVPSAAPHSAPSPLSMQQQWPTSGSNTNVAGDPQAVRLRLYLPPGWVGSDSPPLCHVIDIEMATTDQRLTSPDFRVLVLAMGFLRPAGSRHRSPHDPFRL